jgi:hypothetical protein
MPEDKEFQKYLERRAEELGLPTDPAAYQDGGLAVAATTFGINDADFLVAMFRASDIPAWVEGAGMASWYWHWQFGMHPAGIRILVPLGRLAEAQALLAQHRPAGAPAVPPTAPSGSMAEAARMPAEEQPAGAEEPEDPAYPLYRRARGLAYLLLIGPAYPVILVLVCILVVRIHQQKKRTGPTPHLGKARWIAWFVLIYLLMFATVVGAVFLATRVHWQAAPGSADGVSVPIEVPIERELHIP